MRKVVNYIPYKKTNGAIEVYIQRRTLDAPVRPGLLGLFGGGKEDGESDLDTLHREVFEELSYIPQSPLFLGTYTDEVPTNKNVYYEEVSGMFEEEVHVNEGQYGVFMNYSQIKDSGEITAVEKQILFDLICKVSAVEFSIK